MTSDMNTKVADESMDEVVDKWRLSEQNKNGEWRWIHVPSKGCFWQKPFSRQNDAPVCMEKKGRRKGVHGGQKRLKKW